MSFKKAINHGGHNEHGEKTNEDSKMFAVVELRYQG